MCGSCFNDFDLERILRESKSCLYGLRTTIVVIDTTDPSVLLQSRQKITTVKNMTGQDHFGQYSEQCGDFIQ